MAVDAKDYFARLREIRESRDLSLETISAKTRINLTFLRAIEAQDFKFLPKPYVRSFFKTYLQEIGADTDEALAEYDKLLYQSCGLDAVADPLKAAGLEEPAGFALHSRNFTARLPKVSVSGIATAVVVLLLGGIYYVGGLFDTNAKTFTVSGEQEYATRTRIVRDVAGPSATGSSAPISRLSKQVTVVGLAREEVWVRIQIDDEPLHEATFQMGESRTWEANERITLTVGKSQGMIFTLNGAPVEDLGTANTLIWKLVFTKDGIQEKILRLRTDIGQDIAAQVRPDSTL